MSADKTVTVFGCVAALEGSYNAGASFDNATDAVLLREPADLDIEFTTPGDRGQAPAGMGNIQGRAPSGKRGSVTLPVEGRGLGSAYGPADRTELDALLRACGLTATVDATGGSEQIAYTPAGYEATPESVALQLWAQGELWPLTGGYGTLDFAVENGGDWMFNIAVQGMAGTESDASLPSLTYDDAVPPKADGLTCDIGSWTGTRIRSFEFSMNRELSPREILGYTPGYRNPTVTILVEAAALADFNPYDARDNATVLALDMSVGAPDVYNRLQFTAPAWQIDSVSREADGATALWRLEGRLRQSDLVTPDDFTLTFLD